MSSGVREPVAAGLYYAADSQQLRVDIDAAINGAETEFAGPKLLVLPSCGLTVAPEVAGTAMLMLESERDHIDRVVIIADHRPGLTERSFAGIAVPRSIAFRTPLGDLLVDRDLVEAIGGHPSVSVNDRPFIADQSIEVHLPPVQRLLGNVRILPVLVGDASTAEIVDVIERLWGGRNTLIIVSSDFGRGKDPDLLHEQAEKYRMSLRQSDGPSLVDSPLSSAKTLAALASITSRRSMGLNELAANTIEDPDRVGQHLEVISFGAWESFDVSLAEVDVRHLRALALAAIHLTVLGGTVAGTDAGRIPPALIARRASVVTLRRDGQTRGSAGMIEADRSLAASVCRNAAAACADPRLPSIQPNELDDLDMAITVVSPIERVFPRSWDELAQTFTPGRHGMLVTVDGARAAQLPSMWGRYRTPEQFVGSVAHKVNMAAASDVGYAAWYRFETIDY